VSSQSLQPERRESLEAAFNLFNQLSEELTGSYRQLQEQVLQLNRELAATRSDRMSQLAEKERLADRLGRLLETLPAGVVVLDGEERVVEANPAALRLIDGLTKGASWKVLELAAFEAQRLPAADWTLRDGRLLSVSSCALEHSPGRILVLLDVSETRRLQEHLNRQERLGAMGEMSAQLAHQLRTPLSSALLYVSQLGRDDLSSPQRERFTGKLRSRLQHMESQIRDMLLFARGGAGAEEPLSLIELLKGFTTTLASELQQTSVSLHLDYSDAEAAQILGRSDALLGVLGNLADNAVQHGARTICIRLSGGPLLTILFSDDGSGIAPEVRHQIFDPFFTTRPAGTGLGLAVAQNVILAHGGEIHLLDSPAPGTRFQIELPRYQSCQREQLTERPLAADKVEPVSRHRSAVL